MSRFTPKCKNVIPIQLHPSSADLPFRPLLLPLEITFWMEHRETTLTFFAVCVFRITPVGLKRGGWWLVFGLVERWKVFPGNWRTAIWTPYRPKIWNCEWTPGWRISVHQSDSDYQVIQRAILNLFKSQMLKVDLLKGSIAYLNLWGARHSQTFKAKIVHSCSVQGEVLHWNETFEL